MYFELECLILAAGKNKPPIAHDETEICIEGLRKRWHDDFVPTVDVAALCVGANQTRLTLALSTTDTSFWYTPRIREFSSWS
jgi:hypothetical protein